MVSLRNWTKTPKSRTRVYWEVAPSRIGFGWDVTRAGQLVHWCLRKANAISVAIEACNQRLDDVGERAELRIKNKRGEIEDARTYGKDPRKSKG